MNIYTATKAIPSKRGPNFDCCLEIHLIQGRKREIRRLFSKFGYFVKRLRRIQIGGFVLKGIPLGGVKELNAKEILSLLKDSG